MLEYGFIYVPNHCLRNKCKLHIFIHDCTMSAGIYETLIIRKTGLLEHAAANNFVVLFPQNWDPDIEPYHHCWTGGSVPFDVNHPQIIAIRKMVETLYDKQMIGSGDAVCKEEGARGNYSTFWITFTAISLVLTSNFI